MLVDHEIIDYVRKGKIVISNFDVKRLNPNSYNLRLSDILAVYHPDSYSREIITLEPYLDPKKELTLDYFIIPDTGLILTPGTLYLGRTLEYTKTYDCVPMLEGRSSLARLGVNIHQTAGFGDVGFEGTWTLEITCVHPVKIYPLMEVCQIFYIPCNKPNKTYKGKYQNQESIQPCKLNFEL